VITNLKLDLDRPLLGFLRRMKLKTLAGCHGTRR
jgi:hypothetical protein